MMDGGGDPDKAKPGKKVGKEIDKLEKDPTIDSNELENKISNLSNQIPS